MAVLCSCMSWTPATSIGPRAVHPSRMSGLREHRESTGLSQSYRESSDLVGKDYSPGSFRLFSCRSTPLSSFFSTFADRFACKTWRCESAHSRQRKWAYSAQFWCNLSPLDATLLDPLVCVADKGLAQYLSLVDATLTKNIGVGARLWLTRHPAKDVCPERPSGTRDLSSHPIADSVLVGKGSFYATLLASSFHSLQQERFTTRFHSAGSALFLKTAGCTGSLPILELATRPSPLATSFASSTHSRGRHPFRRKLNHAVS
jgi:hypothetical protein